MTDTVAVDSAVDTSAPTAPTSEAPKSRVERALAALTPPAPAPAVEPPKVAPEAQTPPPVEDVGVHAKALALASKKEQEAYEARQEAKRYQAELDALKAKEDGRRKLNPLELLKAEHGLDYGELTKAIHEGKYKVPTPEQTALSEHDQKLAALQAKLDAYENEKLTAQQAQVREQNLSYIAEQIKGKAEDYALVAALPGDHAEMILARYTKQYEATGEEPDLHEVIGAYEAAAQKDVESLFASDAVLKKFLSSSEAQTRVMTLLGLTKQNPQLAQQDLKGTAQAKRLGAIPTPRANDPGTRSTPVREASPKSRVERALEAASRRRGE